LPLGVMAAAVGGLFLIIVKRRVRPWALMAGAGQQLESLRARHCGSSDGLAGACGLKQGSRSHAVSSRLPTRNIENNPTQSSRRPPRRRDAGLVDGLLGNGQC